MCSSSVIGRTTVQRHELPCLPAPSTGARYLVLPRMASGISPSTGTARCTLPGPGQLGPPINVPFSPETPASGIGDTGFYKRAGTAGRSTPAAERRRPAAAALRRRRLPRHRVGATAAGDGARRRLHAVLRRHHRAACRRQDRRRSWCAPRTIPPIWPSRAASRTGSSSRTRSGIRARPASGRRCGWKRVPATWIGTFALDAESGALGDRLRSVARAANGGRAAARRASCSVGDQLLADDTYHGRRRRGASPHRAIRSRHRRLSQRAAVEPATPDI